APRAASSLALSGGTAGDKMDR
ncbi:hypothetical protein, partial [Pseudomonas aeruginosa]